ncbi:MAG TPA: DNA polymerase IV, partial [Spirochaetota bacterium]|nr:DNA polymerase IV [Spirochaetota bacterium]
MYCMGLEILHADIDSFFASVEQIEHPSYRNQPVIVGADPMNGKGRGVVST